MIVNSTKFDITLTKEEIELLHKAANEMKKKYVPMLDSESVDDRITASKYVSAYRSLRNDLARLIGVSYMGEDM